MSGPFVADYSVVGTGLDPSLAPDGLGLNNLEERTSELGGSFSLTSAPGYGTAVTFSLPLKGARIGTDQGTDR